MKLSGTALGNAEYKGYAIMEQTQNGSPRFMGEDVLTAAQIQKDLKFSKVDLKEILPDL